MHFYTGKDLARSFRNVRGNTITIAEEIPEEKCQAAPEVRSIGRLLTHIGLTPRCQLATPSDRVVDLATINFAEVIARMRPKKPLPAARLSMIGLVPHLPRRQQERL